MKCPPEKETTAMQKSLLLALALTAAPLAIGEPARALEGTITLPTY